jgi:DNA/RNA-binding domain of Phe-tRNA-synthetase-like protein
MEIEVTPEVRSLGINLIHGSLREINIEGSPPDRFGALTFELKELMRERFPDMESNRRDRTIRSLRDLYWRIGIDPTKQRPSSEALVRRLLKKDLPRINNLVDAGNLASARTLIPIGIYDIGQIRGQPVLRRSDEGEIFKGIGGTDTETPEGMPVLSDDEGIIHLYPYRDSIRTRITGKCRNALITACGARGIREKQLLEAIEWVGRYYRMLKGG